MGTDVARFPQMQRGSKQNASLRCRNVRDAKFAAVAGWLATMSTDDENELGLDGGPWRRWNAAPFAIVH